MKYNEKYGRWVTKGGLVYRYDSKQDKLVLCKQYNTNGYKQFVDSKGKKIRVHRAIYETFAGEITNGYEIDHINTIRDDNRLENLRCVTRKENLNNPLTRKHMSEKAKVKKISSETRKKLSESGKGKTRSKFGEKFKEHFGINYSDNIRLYKTERKWYVTHNEICRWEKEE